MSFVSTKTLPGLISLSSSTAPQITWSFVLNLCSPSGAFPPLENYGSSLNFILLLQLAGSPWSWLFTGSVPSAALMKCVAVLLIKTQCCQ